jgi:hypothetical protein
MPSNQRKEAHETTTAFRAKELAPENMATSAFSDANRALGNLQSGMAGEREIRKFEEPQTTIEQAGETLQRTIELAEELQIATHVLNTKQREDPIQQQEDVHQKLPLKNFPVRTEKRRKDLEQQLQAAKKQQRQLQGQVGIKKDNEVVRLEVLRLVPPLPPCHREARSACACACASFLCVFFSTRSQKPEVHSAQPLRCQRK